MTKADQIREALKGKSLALHELSTDTGISKAVCNVYLHNFLKAGQITRSGDRGAYRYSGAVGSGESVSKVPTEQDRDGREGGDAAASA